MTDSRLMQLANMAEGVSRETLEEALRMVTPAARAAEAKLETARVALAEVEGAYGELRSAERALLHEVERRDAMTPLKRAAFELGLLMNGGAPELPKK